jgi:translation initiation factor IF-2
MQVSLADLAAKYSILPGQVVGVLNELGVGNDGTQFEAEPEELELIEVELESLRASGVKVVSLAPGRTPRDVAHALGVPQNEVLGTLVKKLKTMATLTTTLKDEVVEKLVKELTGCEVTWSVPDAPKPKPSTVAAKAPSGPVKQLRPPVVTIMGHVDHGKTSLLDYIRKANVVDKEFGGITQHIGAYQVNLDEGLITFLDTPGHAAFTAMRARGAQVTDIVILVVAADDGIMPQTIEAISHAKAAKVPIIVAVNKIDKPGANPDKVMQMLPAHELVPEVYGGDVATIQVSALTGAGVPDLLERILLESEVAELTADPKAMVQGVVVEAKLDKGRGPVATVLVQEGTLQVGTIIVCGQAYGKVRAMQNWLGEPLKEAGPSTPVEVIGLSEVPLAGDKVEPKTTEREARDLVDARKQSQREKTLVTHKRRISFKQLKKTLEGDEPKDLNLIVKADVQGSVEAVRGLLDKINQRDVDVKVVFAGVGPIGESDVNLAAATDAIVVGFNVKPDTSAKAAADRERVEIRTYNIIYELLEDIENAAKGMLEPRFEEVFHGKVEVRAVFKLTKAGKVAGSHCVEGKITRNSLVRVNRDKELVYQGKLDSLKNVKQDVREINAGQDCGIRFDGWEEFKEGDLIEAYELVQVN